MGSSKHGSSLLTDGLLGNSVPRGLDADSTRVQPSDASATSSQPDRQNYLASTMSEESLPASEAAPSSRLRPDRDEVPSSQPVKASGPREPQSVFRIDGQKGCGQGLDNGQSGSSAEAQTQTSPSALRDAVRRVIGREHRPSHRCRPSLDTFPLQPSCRGQQAGRQAGALLPSSCCQAGAACMCLAGAPLLLDAACGGSGGRAAKLLAGEALQRRLAAAACTTRVQRASCGLHCLLLLPSPPHISPVCSHPRPVVL